MNLFNGAGVRNGTCDLRVKSALLYRLSYTGGKRRHYASCRVAAQVTVVSVVEQFDTIVVNADQALLVEPADSLLEVALADPKLFGDQLGRTLVTQRQYSALRAQALDDLLGQTTGGLMADRLQAQADLAVGAQLLDIAFFAHAAADELEQLVLVDQAPVLAVDDGLETEVGTFGHQQVDFLADLIAGRHLVQITIQTRGGGETAGAFVEIEIDHAVIADLQRALLFRMRQMKILGQAPVEEQADAIDIHHLEAGELAELDLRFEGGGDQLVFAVEVDEHVEPVLDFAWRVLGDVALGQEDPAVRSTVQIQTEVGVLDHLQRIHPPDNGHCVPPRQNSQPFYARS